MRHRIAAIAACLLACCIVPATAQTRRPSSSFVYAAIDFDHLSTSGTTLNGGDIALGWRYNRFLGLECGVIGARKSGVTVTQEYLELQGLLPLGSRLSLTGSIGGILAQASSGGGHGSGYRVGGGAEYRLTQNLFLRGAYHYQTALAHINDVSVGLAYRF